MMCSIIDNFVIGYNLNVTSMINKFRKFNVRLSLSERCIKVTKNSRTKYNYSKYVLHDQT